MYLTTNYSLETTIITRGTRSLGYGFIKFETEKEAQKASQDLNKQSLDGREINVEVARPKAEGEVRKTRKSKHALRNKTNVSTTKINFITGGVLIYLFLER